MIPSFIDETALHTIPASVLDAVKKCSVIFAENERSTRRFLKALDRNIVIDDFEWFTIHKTEAEQTNNFKNKIKEGKNIAVISEAGCPGIADPGQILAEVAQQMNVTVKPIVGPSSILLALMASGLNGQQFQFNGYLPIDSNERNIKIKQLEDESKKKKCTQIFIETPYRNNQILEALLKQCNDATLICVASEITSERENIKTKAVSKWKKEPVDLHKKPVIFLMLA